MGAGTRQDPQLQSSGRTQDKPAERAGEEARSDVAERRNGQPRTGDETAGDIANSIIARLRAQTRSGGFCTLE